MKVLIIADDLTGALDSAATLANVGLRCSVARRPEDIPAAMDSAPDVLAVSTASRERSVEAAVGSIGQVFDAIANQPTLVFKKVDSRLKGHCAAELATVAARVGITRAVVTPAVPAQGRLTESGRVIGAGIPDPINVAEVFSSSGVTIRVPDAASDEDLDRVIAVAISEAPVLLAGAAGLAAALARYLRPGSRATPIAQLPAPLLLAIGSRDPITLAQIDLLRSARVPQVFAPGGFLSATAIDGTPQAILMQLVAGSDPFDPARANQRFAESVLAITRSGDSGTLLACGGETADAILGALGVGVLHVEGEALPGVPVSTIVARGRRMTFVTKSGGFGAPDALLKIVNMKLGAS